jgi:uncharacterized protein YecT (DUF1311 family)
MKRTLLAIIALTVSGLALADECKDASTQSDLNQCTAAQYQAADKKLNETYQAAQKRAQEPQREQLKKAQIAWIASRDADCELLSSSSEGGSVQPMVRNQCLTDKTAEREAFLSSLLQCEEGDLSCPLPPANAN